MSKHILISVRGHYVAKDELPTAVTARVEDAKIYPSYEIALADALKGERPFPLWKLQRNTHARK